MSEASGLPLPAGQARAIGRPAAPIETPASKKARADLRRVADELEATFLFQLFQAMRASTAAGAGDAGPASPGDSGPGMDMFTALLDETMASEAARRMRRGPGEALYKQLCRHLPEDGAEPASGGTDA